MGMNAAVDKKWLFAIKALQNVYERFPSLVIKPFPEIVASLFIQAGDSATDTLAMRLNGSLFLNLAMELKSS